MTRFAPFRCPGAISSRIIVFQTSGLHQKDGATMASQLSADAEAVKVYLVDDHSIVRYGLTSYLSATGDIEVLGDAADAAAAVSAIEELTAAGRPPDVVLVDLVMPGMDGISLTELLRRSPSPPRIVILSSYGDAESLRSALRAGISGYLLKTSSAEVIAEAVREVSRGGLHLDAMLSASLATAVSSSGLKISLTPRERDVVALVAKGRSNKQIAVALFISERTARTHVSHLLGKIGLQSRIQLAIWAHDNGFPLASADELVT
jgi:DNA-binding NarL/FixJ family response regulator